MNPNMLIATQGVKFHMVDSLDGASAMATKDGVIFVAEDYGAKGIGDANHLAARFAADPNWVESFAAERTAARLAAERTAKKWDRLRSAGIGVAAALTALLLVAAAAA